MDPQYATRRQGIFRHTYILGCPEKEKKSCFLETLDILCSLNKKNKFEPNRGQIGHNLTTRDPFKVDHFLENQQSH